jgi:UDP:flavonoid glycosyltransferase YjiC (YdhE family)
MLGLCIFFTRSERAKREAMATIIIAMLPELGHLNATLKLATALASLGHQVFYLGGSDYEAYMKAQGMQFISLGESLGDVAALPGAHFSQLDLMESLMEIRFHCRPLDKRLGSVVEIFRQEIEAVVKNLRPDLFIIDPFVPDIALIAHQLGMPFVFLNTTLFNPLKETALDRKSPFLAQVPELVLCPREFDFPQAAANNKRRYYLGASVNLQRREAPFAWHQLDAHKSLIYCSLGSQPEACGGAKRFFQTIIEAMVGLPHRQMILTMGAHLNPFDFHSVPSNVFLLNRAPQLQILKKAAVMITHAGLNSIKEAILFGVPMVVFPCIVDQPMNAARIVYHGLGVKGDMPGLTVEEARTLIERVAKTASFRERAASFCERFRNLEEEAVGVKIVEALLASLKQRRPVPASVALSN